MLGILVYSDKVALESGRIDEHIVTHDITVICNQMRRLHRQRVTHANSGVQIRLRSKMK
jgi:hypothetical protein